MAMRISQTALAGVGEKKNQADFALWKKAQPEHIMRWPWLMPANDKQEAVPEEGFPGWHCECTAMGRKYLGEEFDIHGGGMDLVFPHHECEIAQAQASMGHPAVHYWMHNNMITINGQKMGKSYNNFITLDQFFKGEHELLTQPFSPMTIRFFILSAHYRGTVDFSSEALEAAEKGYNKLVTSLKDIKRIQPAKGSQPEVGKFVAELEGKLYDAMNDDLQTPNVISQLFEASKVINTLVDRKAKISAADLETLEKILRTWIEDILGLKTTAEAGDPSREQAFGKVMDMVLDMRAQAKADKDWAKSDAIRDALNDAGFIVKDTADGQVWSL